MGKILGDKVDRLGMIDLCASRVDRQSLTGDVGNLIRDTPRTAEIFIIGRSLAIWSNHHRELTDAILNSGVRCRLAIADPTLPTLQSLVRDDFAMNDLPSCWSNFQRIANDVSQKKNSSTGSFELFGLPAYIPETFAAYTRRDGKRVCSIEVGIGVGPNERPSFHFVDLGSDCIYTKLYRIFEGILIGRTPLLMAP
jgi:hypothetical protein